MNIEQFIDKHIRADVTALVNGFRDAYLQRQLEHTVWPWHRGLQARNLSAPFLDYEAAARAARVEGQSANWRKTKGIIMGYIAKGNAMWPGRAEISAESWEEACSLLKIAPHEIPIIGHYIVTAELADLLEARGERVERDFGGVIVWARKRADDKIVGNAAGFNVVQQRDDTAPDNTGYWWAALSDEENAPQDGPFVTERAAWDNCFFTVGINPDLLDRDPVLLAILAEPFENFERVRLAKTVEVAGEKWTAEDDAAAQKEGWSLFVCSGSQYIPEGAYDIQKADDVGIFNSDDAALLHVNAFADLGFELHKKALRLAGKLAPVETI